MTQIKTFEEACTALKISTEVPDYSSSPERHQGALLAHYKLIIIIEALNEGWTPDWDNDDETKYYPWFSLDSGFGLDYVFYYYSYSYVGSRLCFKTRDIANYAAKQFLDLYKEYMMINK